MKLFPFIERVKKIEKINKQFNRWDKEALLIHVQNGLSKLQTYYCHNGDNVNHYLILNNKPLMNIHGENYFCPTCEKIIKSGYGLQNIDDNNVNCVKLAEETQGDIEKAYELLKPILTLLKNGLYMISKIKMYPTDGEGNYFWGQLRTKQKYKATADTYYKFHYGTGWPCFIYPTQPISRLNMDQVNFYRDEIKKGKKMTGLAFYMEGFISALLDGHHRATAACYEGETIECLTIMQVDSYSEDKKGIVHFGAGGQAIKLDNLKNPRIITKLLTKYFKHKNKEKIQVEKQFIRNQSISIENNIIKELNTKSKKYPEYLTVSFESMVDNISIDGLLKLWNKYDEESEFKFTIILKVLLEKHYNNKNLFSLVKKIIKDESKKEFWHLAYGYLSTFDDKEVENIFISYIVDYEYDKHDKIREIVDSYLNNR